MNPQKVYDLMRKAGELPYGEAKTVLIEDALRYAEASGDDVLAFRVRMELTVAYQYGGEPVKTFGVFSRCLSDYDRDPGKYDDGDRHRLLWHFKAAVSSLTKFPEVPLDRTHAVLDEMERRYRLGGHSLHAVYALREWVARHLGDGPAADRWYAKWHAAPRDELSDCIGCDPTSKVAHLAWRGRDDDASVIAAPVLNEEFTCSEQPQAILTELIFIYLRTGRIEKARDAHRRAYRLMRSSLRDLGDIGVHLEFCARTGNEARGLELLERHLGWLDRAPSPNAAMRFAAGGALVLRRLRDAGHDAVAIRRPAHADRPAGEISIAELCTELTETATKLAGRFDARNGTGHQGDLVRAVLEAEPIIERLPLTPHARKPTVVPVPTLAAPIRTDSTDPIELLDAAEEHWTRREMSAALAAWHRFDELSVDLTPAMAGRRADGLGLERIADDDPQAGVAEWERAADLHAEAGDQERHQSTRSRIGAVLCRIDRTEEGLALLEEATAWFDANAGHVRRRVAARLRLAGAYAVLGRSQDALSALASFAPEAPVDAADIAFERAQILMRSQERREEAMQALQQAREGFRVAGWTAPLAEAALMHGQLLAEDTGDTAAKEAFTEAVQNAPADATMLRAVAHGARGTWLLSHDRAAEGVEDLIEAVAGFTAAGAHPPAAYTRKDLSLGYLRTGRPLEAAEAAEEAISILTELGDGDAVKHARWLLANAQRELGELAEAAETFTALADDEVGERPPAAAECYENAADLLSRLDNDGVAAERFAAAERIYRSAQDPFGAARTQRRGAMCLLWSGQPDAALSLMEKARRTLTELSAEQSADLPADTAAAVSWERALVAYDQARILAAVKRFTEALALTEEAVERFTALGEQDAAAAAAKLRADLQEQDASTQS